MSTDSACTLSSTSGGANAYQSCTVSSNKITITKTFGSSGTYDPLLLDYFEFTLST